MKKLMIAVAFVALAVAPALAAARVSAWPSSFKFKNMKWELKKGSTQTRAVYGYRSGYDMTKMTDVWDQSDTYSAAALMDVLTAGEGLEVIPDTPFTVEMETGTLFVYPKRKADFMKRMPASYNYGYLPAMLIFHSNEYDTDVVIYGRGITIEQIYDIPAMVDYLLLQHKDKMNLQADLGDMHKVPAVEK